MVEMTYHTTIEPARCYSRDLWPSVGVFALPDGDGFVGTAVPVGDTLDGEACEVVWRLVIRGEPLEGGYRVRDGVFQELGDAAVWERRRSVGDAIEAARMRWRASRRSS